MTQFQPSHAMRIGCEHLRHHELCLKWTAEGMGGRQIQEGANEHEMSQKRSLDILLLQYYYSQFVYVTVACFLGWYLYYRYLCFVSKQIFLVRVGLHQYY